MGLKRLDKDTIFRVENGLVAIHQKDWISKDTHTIYLRGEEIEKIVKELKRSN